MATTNYPNGVSSFGLPVLPTVSSGPNAPVTPVGNLFFVSSVVAANGVGDGSSPTSPLATIAAAVAKCTANHGDVIILMPGHAETVSGAAGITLNVAGVTVVPVGVGAARPTLTFSTSTAATVTITAANVSILPGLVGTSSIDQIVSPFVVSGAGCTLNLEWQDQDATHEALRAVLTTAAANNFTLNLTYRGFTAGTHGVNAVRLVGGTTARLNLDVFGKFSTSVVEFVTTATIDTTVSGFVYNSGTTDGSKTVVDTITGSTWYANVFDGAAGLSFDGGSGRALAGSDVATVLSTLTVPSADAVTNVNARDVTGNKTDAGVTAVGTTKSILAYVKGLITMGTVQVADSVANAFAGDVIGNKSDAAVYVPSTTKSLLAYIKGNADLQEGVTVSATATMVNGNTIFTVAGGWIQIVSLVSECMTVNDGTASTLQYQAAPTAGSATAISGASASLAAAAAGASVSLIGTALATAALLNANGPGLGMTTNGGIIVPAGTVKIVVGVGSTTGTWRHMIRYRPLNKGVTVV